ncbi:MAG: hypothetical protein JWR21_942 [Herminiimonas sp.]|nr:hypothetical protein [Herminiimonas sp.]
MNIEQRKQWTETSLFPIELWQEGRDSTPLLCPTPTDAELRTLALAVPKHIQASGWWLDKPSFGHSYLYADDFKGMGRQWIADLPSGRKDYFGEVGQYIAAIHPRTVLRLLDRIEALESALETSRASA